MVQKMNQIDLALDIPVTCNAKECPVEDWLNFLGLRWNSLFLWRIMVSPKGHTELLTLLTGISSKVLAGRLTTLVQRGLIRRHFLKPQYTILIKLRTKLSSPIH